jgi:hypothetical protein
VLENFHSKIDAIGIDLFEDYREAHDRTHIGATANKQLLEEDLKAKGFSEFKLIKSESIDALLALKPIENAVVFIDGNHTFKACMLDFLCAYSKVERGDFIFHNSSNTWDIDIMYMQADGGPFKVIQDIVSTCHVQLVARYDRNTVIRK